jgi:hypothetical protein
MIKIKLIPTREELARLLASPNKTRRRQQLETEHKVQHHKHVAPEARLID